MEKKLSYGFFLPRKLSNDSERRAQVSTSFSLQSTIPGFTLFNYNKSHFVEEVLLQPKNEIVAVPKIEIKWDWVSDVHVYIDSDAVIWFWQYFHVRARQTSEN